MRTRFELFKKSKDLYDKKKIIEMQFLLARYGYKSCVAASIDLNQHAWYTLMLWNIKDHT